MKTILDNVRFLSILQLSLSLILLFPTQGKAQCSKPIIHSDAASVDGVINGSTTSSAIISCIHDNATKFTWLLNGSFYLSSANLIVLSTPLPGGNIQCQYNTDQCTESSESITIILPPVLDTSSLVNVTSDAGDNFTLSCESSGYPYPTITWFHDDKIVGYGSQLYVSNAVEDDGGMYTCLASNEAGYRTSSVWVIVAPSVVSSTVSFINLSSTTTTTTIDIFTTSSINIQPTFLVVTLTSSTKLSAYNSPTESNEGTPNDNLVIILAIVVPGFSLVMLILIGVCYWLMELMTRRHQNRVENEANDGLTMKTSTSYVNASFRDEELFDNNDDDEEDMMVEILSSNSGYKAVFTAHTYNSDNTNLFGSSKHEIKDTKKIAVLGEEAKDDSDGIDNSTNQSTSPSDEVSNEERQDNKSPHVHTLNTEEKCGPLSTQSLMEEDPISLKDDNISETMIGNDLVGESTSSGGQRQEQQQQDSEDFQEQKPPSPSTCIPKWLTERRKDNRSDPLSGIQLINLIRKLDLTSTKDVRNHLSEQFKSVPFNLTSPHNWPHDAMSKNRYRDVVPTPETAVTLTNTGEPLSTYINANFIKGFDGKEKSYISAQGPLYDTVPDFWRMIWENEVEVIVMVTALYEGGKNKCAKYWPSLGESDTQSYGDLVVRNVHEETYENYKITFLCASMMNDPGSMRDVYHFSFLGWPDFGVPNEGYAMLQLWKAVESIRNPKQTLLVHCSAGIGRSGTYIAIDMGIHQYEQDGVVDPPLILSLLRQDRGGMVQTLEQYEYLHRVLSCYIVQNLK